MRDSCIPPGILGGTYAFYPGSWSGFTYPTWDSLSHPWKYCFAVFILTKHFCKSSNTYGSSTHSTNIWHADKTEVVAVPFEKIWDAIDSVGTIASSVERPTEESRCLAVLERVAERLSRASLVDLGTGTLGSSSYLLYFVMWLACVVSHLCREHNSSGFRVFLSSTTFGHKSCILVRFLSIIST